MNTKYMKFYKNDIEISKIRISLSVTENLKFCLPDKNEYIPTDFNIYTDEQTKMTDSNTIESEQLKLNNNPVHFIDNLVKI